MPSTSSSSLFEHRRVPHANVVSSQSAARKYDKRTASEPPRKPPRTFQQLHIPQHPNLKLSNTICTPNQDLSNRIVENVRTRQFWMDIEPGLFLFANPFDDLSGQRFTQNSCCSQETMLLEEAMKHEKFFIFVRGRSGSGKSALAERLFLKVMETVSSHLPVAHAIILALRPLMRYSSNLNPIASFGELGFQFAFEGVKVIRSSISRGAISPTEEMPIILSMLMSQLSTKEKVLYRITDIPSRPASKNIECGWSLEQFRSALRRLSISTVEVEKILCAIILIGTLQIDPNGQLNTVRDATNSKNLLNASQLLGVSPNSFKKLIESSASRDQGLSGVKIACSLLLEALIDYILEHANSLLDEGIIRGKQSPTESDSSTADSGIDISRSAVTTIEVETRQRGSLLESMLRQRRLLMQSLFSQSNCQSSFAVRIFSSSLIPHRTHSRNRDDARHQSIICLRTNDDCEYMRPNLEVIKKQLQAVRRRIDESAPEVPIRDY